VVWVKSRKGCLPGGKTCFWKAQEGGEKKNLVQTHELEGGRAFTRKAKETGGHNGNDTREGFAGANEGKTSEKTARGKGTTGTGKQNTGG